jgi:hypothetical protein
LCLRSTRRSSVGVRFPRSRQRAGDDPALLEVLLIDSESGQWESLGTLKAATNTLDFSVPASGSLDRFDEIKVVYHRPAIFDRKSARIAIERFVITPRY